MADNSTLPGSKKVTTKKGLSFFLSVFLTLKVLRTTLNEFLIFIIIFFVWLNFFFKKNQSRFATCQWGPQTVEKIYRKRLLFGDLDIRFLLFCEVPCTYCLINLSFLGIKRLLYFFLFCIYEICTKVVMGDNSTFIRSLSIVLTFAMIILTCFLLRKQTSFTWFPQLTCQCNDFILIFLA